MFKNALFATVVVFIAVVFYLMDELRFLIPYRDAILERHGREIALFSVVLFLNLLAGFFVLTRRLLLKDTGHGGRRTDLHRSPGPVAGRGDDDDVVLFRIEERLIPAFRPGGRGAAE